MNCLLSCSVFILVLIKFHEPLPFTNNDPNETDMLVFRQFWPATSCMFPGDNQCAIPSKVTNWGIHGLWYILFILFFHHRYRKLS